MVVQEEGCSSSSVTSSPLQSFSLMSLSPSGLTASPFGVGVGAGAGAASSPWVRELKSDERGLYLIHLLLNCANHVASGALDHANSFLDTISLLASPDGDTMQRIASYFTEALARRILRSWPGLYRALCASTPRLVAPAAEAAQARRHFLDLAPFLRLAFLVSNQAIIEAMDGEKMVHVIDLSATAAAADPSQWLALLQALSVRPEGPPHLRLTAVGEHREALAHMAGALSEEAEKLDIPFQFNPVVARLDALDVASLRVKTGEALAISSVLQLHSLLASSSSSCGSSSSGEDVADRLPPAAAPPMGSSGSSSAAHLHSRMVGGGHKGQGGTLGELLEKDHHHANGFSPPSADSGPLAPSARMDGFLAALWGLSPKIMVVTEQESNHNGAALSERFMEALNFYAALFDCLESTVARQSVERARVEKLLFGEEINNIISCEGLERRERHERLERWVRRLDGAGFGRVPLSYYGLLQARRMLQSFGCEAYKVKEDSGCFMICWQDRPMYSVSAWRCRRYD
ncbi:putative scarecrow-like protein 3 isoform X1 [Iris pallida]|uniref:Scarecrow-like protein 3 isoform X1 n=1 Tax=Iris pallida TaxID=29817 RepID=A0AAX6DGH4_IRIPA|nr:putative scarecrow-like protein 3 isoform X1 [Iris pallida]